MKLPLTYFQVDFGDGPKEYVTCADIERLSTGRGIPVEAVVGIILRPREQPDDPLTPDNFRANAAFVAFLQQVMTDSGDSIDELRQNAEAVGDGILYVIDERASRPVEGREWSVRSDDLIGEFDVKSGNIVPGTYRRNPEYRVFNENGFFQLTENIAQCLMVALDNLPDPDDPTPSWDWMSIN